MPRLRRWASQVLLGNGRLRLEFDEPIQGDELRDAVGDGRLQLEQIFGDGTTEPVPVVIEQEAPFVIPPLEPQGLMAETARAETEERSGVDDLMGATVGARSTTPLASGQEIHFRRLLIRPTQPLEEGTQVRLTVAAEAMQDRFQNQASAGIDETFTWAETGAQVVADQAPPEVRAVRLKGNRLEIEFSEEPDLATLGAIELGPATAGLEGLELGTSEQPTWQLQDDSVTVITEEPLPSGERQVTVGTGLADLFERTLGETFSVAVNVPATLTDVAVFKAEESGVVNFSSVGNRHGFHGRPLDPETGLLYFRHRYYDPELGRFISADPLGYVDGPSMYGFAGYSPMNFEDPLGLEVTTDERGLNVLKDSLKKYGKPKLARSLRLAAEVVEIEGVPMMSLWIPAAREDRVIKLLLQVILDRYLKLRVRIVRDPSLVEAMGGKHPEPRVPDDGFYTSMIELDPYIIARVKFRRDDASWIDGDLHASLIHEIAHAWFTKAKGLKSNFRRRGEPGPTDKEAVEFEDLYRAAVGLPERGIHDVAVYCPSGDWDSWECKSRLYCGQLAEITAGNKFCRDAYRKHVRQKFLEHLRQVKEPEQEP